MPVDPELQEVIDAKLDSIPQWDLPIEKVRENFSSHFKSEPIDMPTEDVAVGRLYNPQKKAPLILFFHGGGFVKGTLDNYDAFCTRLADATGHQVLSAHYRLAPENTYPAAHEDAITALKAAAKLSKKLILCGNGSGGNLAAYATLWARDHKKPKITHQILINPMLDLSMSFPSIGMPETEVLVTRDDLEWYYDNYYNLDNDLKNPDISLTWNKNFEKLPPTLILSAEYDTLRDEAEDFSAKLKRAGTRVACKRYTGMVHGFALMPQVPQSDQALGDIARFLES